VAGTDTTRYAYDELGNLVRVVLATGDTIGYLIDGLNRRVAKTLNGRVVQGWLYQNELHPAAELDSLGNVVARYVYGTRGHVPDYVVRGDSTYRLVTDQLGSVRVVVNASTGAVADRIDYDAWGNVTLDTNPGSTSLGYAGGLTDVATGLVRFGARDYDPSSGRWTARDPVLFDTDTWNSFDYASLDPINLRDAEGLAPVRSDDTGGRGHWQWLRNYFAEGKLYGFPPQAYIGDKLGVPGAITSATCPIPPPDIDVDVAKFYGRWWWVWGRVYMTPPVVTGLGILPSLPVPAPFGGILLPTPGKDLYFRKRYPDIYR